MTTPQPPSLVDLVRTRVLDAELGALLWVLVEGRVPVVAAVPEGRSTAGGDLVSGLVCSIRSDVDQADASRLLTPAAAGSLVRGRLAGGVIESGSLAEVREKLGGGPLPLTPDQLTFLGCVLVLGGTAPTGPLRVIAAHYVRPLARDGHGHTQRLDPAVLATWDAAGDRWEHFAWGVLPEIAARLGRPLGELEADLHHRRDDLGGLAAAGVTGLDEVRRLVAGYRTGYGHPHRDAP